MDTPENEVAKIDRRTLLQGAAAIGLTAAIGSSVEASPA
jgi:hypothetical protein